MTRYRPVIRIVPSLILWIMAPYVFAQGGGTVTVGGVRANALPMLSTSAIMLVAIAILVISVIKLRRHQAVGLNIALVAIGASTLLMVKPISAIVDLAIPNSSPACSGERDILNYDSETSPRLTNECTSTTVSILQYSLPCPSDIWEGSGSIGTLLAPGESTELLSCGDYPPEFTLGAPISIPEDAGPQTFDHWITGISPGPASEATQTVSFTTSSDQPALFSVQPAITPDGTLTFTAADDAWGDTNITVTATDSAGTTSSQSFVLAITPVNDPPFFTLSSNSLSMLEDNGQDLNTDQTGPDFDSPPDGASYTQVSIPGVVSHYSAGSGESDQDSYFTVDFVSAHRTDTSRVVDLSATDIFHDGEIGITESGALEFKLNPHHWGEVELDITLTDSEGATTPAQRLGITIDPVWDNIPTAHNYGYKAGKENSDCITLNLRANLHRNIGQVVFIIKDFGSESMGTLNQEDGTPITLPHISTEGRYCYKPAAHKHSRFNPETGEFDAFSSVTYQIWTGLGDPYTGKSPSVPGHPDVYNELSVEHTVDIIVTPVF